jgi:hypothetical protein
VIFGLKKFTILQRLSKNYTQLLSPKAVARLLSSKIADVDKFSSVADYVNKNSLGIMPVFVFSKHFVNINLRKIIAYFKNFRITDQLKY